MSEAPPKSLAEQMAESWAAWDAEREAAMPATADYTGNPCVNCGRIRVFLRRDGQYQCEKCEAFNPPPVASPLSESSTHE